MYLPSYSLLSTLSALSALSTLSALSALSALSTPPSFLGIRLSALAYIVFFSVENLVPFFGSIILASAMRSRTRSLG